MEFYFEIVHCPGLYHQAAEAISRLRKLDQEPVDETEDVDDDIPTYCILGQESDALCATEEEGVINLHMPTSKELFKVQLTDAYCQNMVKLVGTDAQFAVDEKGLKDRKAPIDGSMQVIVPKIFCQEILYNRHCLILAGYPGTCRMYDEL